MREAGAQQQTCGRSIGQTDGRTLARFIDPALLTILYISVQVWITCRHYVKCRCSVCATVLTLSFTETKVSNFSLKPPKVWDVINMQNVSKHVSDRSLKIKIFEHSVHDEFLLTSVTVGLNWFDALVSYQTLALLHVLHINWVSEQTFGLAVKFESLVWAKDKPMPKVTIISTYLVTIIICGQGRSTNWTQKGLPRAENNWITFNNCTLLGNEWIAKSRKYTVNVRANQHAVRTGWAKKVRPQIHGQNFVKF